MDVERTAHEQTERAIEGAMSPLSNSPPDAPDAPAPDATDAPSSPSEFLKKHLSVEVTVPIVEEDVYPEPTLEPYYRASSYMEQHGIVQLLQGLAASVLYNKPDEPLDYMIEQVETMRKLQRAEMRMNKK